MEYWRKNLSDDEILELRYDAQRAAANSHAPYSKLATGVAVLCESGIVTGTSVQNAAYPTSACAARNAVAAAVCQGATNIRALFIVSTLAELDSTKEERLPELCGACVEFISHFASGRTHIIRGNEFGPLQVHPLADSLGYKKETLPPGLHGGEACCCRSEVSVLTLKKYVSSANVEVDDAVKSLCNAAIRACASSHTCISHFPVGAAVLTDAGVFSGSNVEHPVLTLGLCAERTALHQAVAAGAKVLKSVAVVCYKMDFGTPCGGCRQALSEFGNPTIHLIKLNKQEYTYDISTTTLSQLLPGAFTL